MRLHCHEKVARLKMLVRGRLADNHLAPGRWPGAKQRQVSTLAALLPDEIDHTFVPMCGMCSLYFHLRKRKKITGAQTFLSDDHLPLIRFLRGLQGHGPYIAERLFYWKSYFDNSKQDMFDWALEQMEMNISDQDYAVAFAMFERFAWSRALLATDRSSTFSENNEKELSDDHIRRLVLYGELLEGARIECEDFTRTFERAHEVGQKAFLFADSPYFGKDVEVYLKRFPFDKYRDHCADPNFNIMVTLDTSPESMGITKGKDCFVHNVSYEGTHDIATEQIAINYCTPKLVERAKRRGLRSIPNDTGDFLQYKSLTADDLLSDNQKRVCDLIRKANLAQGRANKSGSSKKVQHCAIRLAEEVNEAVEGLCQTERWMFPMPSPHDEHVPAFSVEYPRYDAHAVNSHVATINAQHLQHVRETQRSGPMLDKARMLMKKWKGGM
ncbi:MAG: hypothetical protein HWE34_15065 [Methylocystaceae bacterium]|nr:hypothetical protein [Methylocystaceae bacterium]